MKQNSSEADSSVSDNSSVSKFISRWNVDGFLTKFPHERDWFLYFGNVYCFPGSFSHLKYLDKLWSKFFVGFILRRIIRLTDNPSRQITRL